MSRAEHDSSEITSDIDFKEKKTEEKQSVDFPNADHVILYFVPAPEKSSDVKDDSEAIYIKRRKFIKNIIDICNFWKNFQIDIVESEENPKQKIDGKEEKKQTETEEEIDQQFRKERLIIGDRISQKDSKSKDQKSKTKSESKNSKELPLFPVSENSKKIHVVGDTHGDLNPLLLNLIKSKIVRFKKGEPSYKIVKLPINSKIGIETFDIEKLDKEHKNNNFNHHSIIPNLEFNSECEDEMVFLGDVMDRGVFSRECLLTLIDLFSKQALLQDKKDEGKKEVKEKDQEKVSGIFREEKDKKDSPKLSKTKRSEVLHWVFADHELYGLDIDNGIMPGYLKDSVGQDSEVKGLRRGEDLEAIAEAINYSIRQNFIKYAYVGNDNLLFSHSFISRKALRPLLRLINLRTPTNSNIIGATRYAEIMISKAEVPEKELEKVKESLKYLIGLKKKKNIDYHSKEYQNHLKIAVDHFNKILKYAAKHRELYRDTLTNHSSSHPLFAPRISPIWIRGSWLPLPGFVGHSPQENYGPAWAYEADGVRPSKVKRPGLALVVADKMPCYRYNKEQKSHPSNSFLEKDGRVHSQYFVNEKRIFIKGGAVSKAFTNYKFKDFESSIPDFIDAIRNGDYYFVEFAIKKYPEINLCYFVKQDDQSISISTFHEAIYHQNLDIAKLLYETHGRKYPSLLNQYLPGYRGTPLSIAVSNQNLEIVRYLKSLGVDPNKLEITGQDHKDKISYKTPLEIIYEKFTNSDFKGERYQIGLKVMGELLAYEKQNINNFYKDVFIWFIQKVPNLIFNEYKQSISERIEKLPKDNPFKKLMKSAIETRSELEVSNIFSRGKIQNKFDQNIMDLEKLTMKEQETKEAKKPKSSDGDYKKDPVKSKLQESKTDKSQQYSEEESEEFTPSTSVAVRDVSSLTKTNIVEALK